MRLPGQRQGLYDSWCSRQLEQTFAEFVPPNPTGRCVCAVDRNLEFGEPDLRTVRMSSLCSRRRHCIFHADCHSNTLFAVQISLSWKDVPEPQRHMENDLSIIW